MTIKCIRHFARTAIYTFFSLLPIREDLITFEAFAGKRYAGNPKAIYQRLKQYGNKYRCVWFVNKDAQQITLREIPAKDMVIRGTIPWLYYTARSKYWIKNTGSYGGIKKRKGQIYINTWHSYSVLKKVGYDIDDIPDELRIPLDIVKEWDWYAAGNETKARVLSRSFGYKGKILIPGMPRVDAVVNHSSAQVKQIRETLRIPEDKTIFLYAPTFRDGDVSGNANRAVIARIKVPDNCLLLIRFHYYNNAQNIQMDNMIDVTDYPDINDLMIISDLLISDYSSVIFDYANLKRPVFLYAYDLDDYMKTRGLYIDYESEMPGPIYKSADALNKALENW